MPKFTIAACLLLAACVAPEDPPPPRLAPIAAQPATTGNGAQFEAAPTPNRAIGRPAANDVVRVAH